MTDKEVLDEIESKLDEHISEYGFCEDECFCKVVLDILEKHKGVQ